MNTAKLPGQATRWLLEPRIELLRMLREPAFIIPVLAFPTLFYLLFGALLNRGSGAEYLLATYGVFGVMGVALFGFGVNVATDREHGYLTWRRTLPAPASGLLTARLVMAALIAVVVSLLLASAGVLFGNVRLEPSQWLLLLAVNLAGVLPFAAIGMYVGTLTSASAAPVVLNLIYLPMAFLGGLWLPLSMLPPAFGQLAPLWPAWHQSQLALKVIGRDAGLGAGVHLAVLAAVALAFLTLARRRLGVVSRTGRRPWVGLAVAGVLVSVAATATALRPGPAPAPEPAAGFVVEGARIFDGRSDLGAGTVVVRGGHIHAVGGDVQPPAGLPVVDGRGMTLLPGLIDAHVHAFGAAQQDMVRLGVTTGLDMHGPAARLPAIRAARLDPDHRVADLWAAGTAVTVAGGHGTQYGIPVPVVDATTGLDAFIAARVAEGADFIKLIIEDLGSYGVTQRLPTLTMAQVRGIALASHRHERLALAHVATLADARMALEAGVDGLVHIFTDAVADQELVDSLGGGRFVIPTLTVAASVAGSGQGAQLMTDAELAPRLSGGQRGSLAADFGGDHPARLAHALESVRRLHRAGIPLLAGSDAPNPGTAHGASLHHELELLVRAGLSPGEALAAATSVPAALFSIPERGRIAPGMRADLLLVRGNPLQDIRASRAIERVWKNGQPVSLDVDAAPAAPAAAVPAGHLVSDFDTGTFSARFGSWQPTTDRMAGGTSDVDAAVAAGGTGGSPWALQVKGEVRPGFPFPWAGVIFFPAEVPMQPADLSARSELVFQVRGDGRRYEALLFSGPGEQAMPARQGFVAGPEWQQVRLPLSGFPGGDLRRVRGIAFTAGDPHGSFEFFLDTVELR